MTTKQALQLVRKIVNTEKQGERPMEEQIVDNVSRLNAIVWEIHDILEMEGINEDDALV